MKANEFKNFFEALKKDTETVECMAYAFFDLTPRQLAKVLDWYLNFTNDWELYQTDKGLYFKFGKRCKVYMMLVSDYWNLGGEKFKEISNDLKVLM